MPGPPQSVAMTGWAGQTGPFVPHRAPISGATDWILETIAGGDSRVV